MDTDCKNCPLPIWWDDQDGIWRHAEHEGQTCGSLAFIGHGDGVAEPV